MTDHDSSLPPNPDDNAPDDPERRRVLTGLAAVSLGLAMTGCKTELGWSSDAAQRGAADLRLDAALHDQVKHIVVIYAENRSFANLYGNFPGVQHPLDAVSAERYRQLDRDGKTPLPRLPAIWGGLVPQAQEVDGRRYMIGQNDLDHLSNRPFRIADAHGTPLPTGVITRDLVHRFYHNQMQINAGRNNQFAAWGDSGGLVMGHYRNSADTLRLWNLAQQYTLCDNFFMAAFGGSWLNHIFLISAQAPFYPDVHNSPAKKLVSVVPSRPLSDTGNSECLRHRRHEARRVQQGRPGRRQRHHPGRPDGRLSAAARSRPLCSGRN